MIRKMLYKTPREGSGYTMSLTKPETGKGYKVRWRLIAEEGKAITDGERIVTVIDVVHRKECEAWTDCNLPEKQNMLPIDEGIQ